MSHRRRGVGVGKRKPAKLGGDSRDTSPPPASAIADRLNTDAIEHARSVVEQLKRDLNAFAESHKDDISDDPAFRSKFLQMCALLEIDPITSNQTFLGRTLGLGDYYYKLALKVQECCVARRGRDGGVIKVNDVVAILAKKNVKATPSDISIALSKLSVLGASYRVVSVENEDYVFSVPGVLDEDVPKVVSLAQKTTPPGVGCVTVGMLCRTLGWDEARAKRVLDRMVRDGMCWIERIDGETAYWLWGVWWSGKDEANK
mmetsp:Transcript_16614/g.34284  ORF Transcript_16614/g.34284 Transcript_16614/m.34284 type:complete len:259 (-) Transcript_16614:7-783(-)